jgi:phage terminase Nu1 subunit (DNA packaging protein)
MSMGSAATIEAVTATELGELLGLSERSIRELPARGHAVRAGPGRYDLRASVRTFVVHLRAEAARGGDALAIERAREAHERADSLALKNAAARRDLVSAVEVERAWSGILRDVRARLLAVPGRVAQQLPTLTRADVAIVEAEVRNALTEAGGGAER